MSAENTEPTEQELEHALTVIDRAAEHVKALMKAAGLADVHVSIAHSETIGRPVARIRLVGSIGGGEDGEMPYGTARETISKIGGSLERLAGGRR